MSEFEAWVSAGIDDLRRLDRVKLFEKDLLAHLESIRNNGRLQAPFEESTDRFIDKSSPTIINEILNTVTKDENLAKILNSILGAYIALIKTFIFSDHTKFVSTVQKIATDSTALFYTGMTQSYAFGGGNSGRYKANVKLLVKSDFLQFCIDKYKNDPTIPEATSYVVFNFVASLRGSWNKKQYKTFIRTCVPAYLKRIDNIEDKEFRNSNEKQISAMFSLISTEVDEDDKLSEEVAKSEIKFSMRMLRSEYLNKRFCALQNLKEQRELSDETIEQLEKMNVIEVLLNDMHKELVPGFVWLLKTMMNKGKCSLEQFQRFWNFILKDCVSAIDNLSLLVTDVPKEFRDEFWRLVKETTSFPIQIYPFFRKISTIITVEEKNVIINAIFQNIEREDFGNDYVDEMVLTVAFYLSDDEISKEGLENRCAELLSQNKHVVFTLSLMKRIAFYFGKEEAQKAFHRFLCSNPEIEKYTDLYMDWLGTIFRNLTEVISEEDSEKMIGIVMKLIPEKTENLKTFFESVSRGPKEIFPKVFFSKLIQNISTQIDSSVASLIVVLFKQLNRDHFETTALFNDLWAKTVTDCESLDAVWSYFYGTAEPEMADFLARLYSLCVEPESIKSMIMRCIGKNITIGSLLVISNAINLREMWSVRDWSVTNKWKRQEEGVKVSVHGDLECELQLPHSIHSQALTKGISAMTLTRPEKFSIRIGDKTLTPGNLAVTPNLELSVKSSIGKIAILDRITNHLNGQQIECIAVCLSDSDEKLACAAYKILKLLPTSKNELSLIEANQDWETLFDETHFWLLKYRLNEIGKHALTSQTWVSEFIASNGALIMLRKLILESKLYKRTGLVVEAMSAVSKADAAFGNTLNQTDLQLLGDCLYEALTDNESLAILFIDLIGSILQANGALAESMEGISDLVRKTIFYGNKVVRGQAAEFLKRYKTKELLIGLLPCACCDNSSEYFEVLSENIDTIYDPGCFIMFSKLLMDRFAEAGNGFFDVPPCQSFVSGMVSLLNLLIEREQESEIFVSLADFLLKNIAFNSRSYYVIGKTFFSLLHSIMEKSTQASTAIREFMSEKHALIDGTMKPSQMVFSSSHELKGLRNLGATCYANSVLQQLFAVPEFRDEVLAKEHDKDSWYFFFQLLFARLTAFPAPYIDTTEFFSHWTGWSGEKVNVREQQDAVEFLQLLLDKINDMSPDTISVFQGEVQHDVVGVSVDFKSSAVEKFTTLCMEVCEQNNLEESINTFLLPDYHKNYSSEEFGQIDVQRFHKILRAPTVLVLHLKRFDYDLTTGRRMKISKRYLFPHDLDVTRAMQDPSEKIEYELSGVVVHLGVATAGHYYSFCKVDDKTWMSFNDTLVREFDPKTLPEVVAGVGNATSGQSISKMREDTAYILFYRKKGVLRPNRKDMRIADGLLHVLSTEISEMLLHATLSNVEYAQFVLSLDDGQFCFDYMTKCLTESSDVSLVELFINKCKSVASCDRNFANYVVSSQKAIYLMIVVNGNAVTRKEFTSFVCYVMELCDRGNRDALIEFLVSMLSDSVKYWRHYDDLFMPLLQFGSEDLLPSLFSFLEHDLMKYNATHSMFETINLNTFFELIIRLLNTDELKEKYKDFIFSEKFLACWFQSKEHSVTLVRLLRGYVSSFPEVTKNYFKFILDNKESFYAEAAAGHLAVVFPNITKKEMQTAFAFMSTKNAAFLQPFIDSLTSQIADPVEPFRQCFFDTSDVWIDTWLFGLDVGVRQSVKRFALKAFECASHDELQKLLVLLLSKVTALAKLVSSRKNNLYYVTHGLTLDMSLPTNTYYDLACEIVEHGKLNEVLCNYNQALATALTAHRKLNMKNNFPRDGLVKLICLANSSAHFFKGISDVAFFKAFDDLNMAVDEHIKTALQVIDFTPKSAAGAFGSSTLFGKIVANCLSESCPTANQFSDALCRLANPSFCNQLWNASLLTQFNEDRYVTVSLEVLRSSCYTSGVFVKRKCHETVASILAHKLQDEECDTSKLVDLLYRFSDMFEDANIGWRTWFGRDAMQPLFDFWGAREDLVHSLFVRMNDRNDASSISRLLGLLSYQSRPLFVMVHNDYVSYQRLLLQPMTIETVKALESLEKVLKEVATKWKEFGCLPK